MTRTDCWVELNQNGEKEPLRDEHNGLMYFTDPLIAENYLKTKGISGKVIRISSTPKGRGPNRWLTKERLR